MAFGAAASLSQRFTERKLKAFIAFVLIVVFLRLLVGLFCTTQVVSSSSPTLLELGLSAVFGLLIGIVAGSVGVAVVNFRYLF